jgi:hypothetical protein
MSCGWPCVTAATNTKQEDDKYLNARDSFELFATLPEEVTKERQPGDIDCGALYTQDCNNNSIWYYC